MVNKRIITMQDLSCLGKCSLNVALPIFAVLGIEAIPLPTTVLSSHTAYKDYVKKDMSDIMKPFINHWKKENIKVDGISIGYLASSNQVEDAISLINNYPEAIKLLDPCIADNGKFYSGFDYSYIDALKELIHKVDVICPNITEACFILGKEYKDDFKEEEIKEILKALKELGPKEEVVTSVKKEAKFGIAIIDSLNNTPFYFKDKIEGSYFGTGDVYSATFFSYLIQGKDFKESAIKAVNYVYQVIKQTKESNGTRDINLESSLCYLMDEGI